MKNNYVSDLYAQYICSCFKFEKFLIYASFTFEYYPLVCVQISFCLPPGSYRLTLAMFSNSEDPQAISRISLGNECDNYTVTDISHSKILYM